MITVTFDLFCKNLIKFIFRCGLYSSALKQAGLDFDIFPQIINHGEQKVALTYKVKCQGLKS